MMDPVFIRYLGQQDYQTCWEAMKHFTDHRTSSTPDEIWVLEHSPVFTQGQNGKAEHVLDSGDIPLIKVDRGGQVTYHGPGQLVVYMLIDLKRKKLNIRQLVTLLEESVIDVLKQFNIEAHARNDAPGVYVDQAKISSVGLRIRKGCSYHGLAFNIKMDLKPFSRINPCGFPNLKIIQLSDLIENVDMKEIETKLVNSLIKNIGYTTPKKGQCLSYEFETTRC